MIDFKKNTIYEGEQYVLRLFGFTCWSSCIGYNGSWFRIFGYGISWVDNSEPLLFSQRIGEVKFLRFNGKRFHILNPRR